MAATDEQTPNHTKDSLPIVSHGTFQKIPSVASLDSRKSHLDMSDINQTELRRVITGFSHRYSGSHEDGLPEFRTDHPTLDPKSPEFDIHQWLRAFIGSFQTTGVSNHKTSVIFKDLSVYGTGAALQVQQTVGTVISAPLRLGEFFSFAKPQPKRILHSFHGILKSGELLVVLGRPGSGCSTLLKTICGEMHGISLGEQSVVHYDGVPQQTMITEFKGEAAYNQEVRDTLTVVPCY
jgi:ATP-binding cassette subfamily G (WHITE) protein 2 (PDR)